MKGILQCAVVLAVILFGLSACGGESSGESTGEMTDAFSCANFTNLSAQAAAGCSIYIDPVYACDSCHGRFGEGTSAGGPVDNTNDCLSCVDHTQLTNYNELLMPSAGGGYDPTTCIGQCASDVSQYIIEGFVQGKVKPGANNAPGIIVNPTSGLQTTEAGAMATFTVGLNSVPTDDVTINVMSDNVNEGTIVGADSHTFNAGNWTQAYTVMVAGVNDVVVDALLDTPYNVVVTAVSADPNYAAIDPADVSLVNTDDEVAGQGTITVNPTVGLVTSEDGDTATFDISIATAPTAPVTIGLSSNNTAEGIVNPASIVIDQNNFMNAQTVTVTGVDDAAAPMVDGPVAYSIVTAAAVSTDRTYGGVNPSDVSVTNNDNDVQPVIATFTAAPASNAANPIAYDGTVTLTWASDGDTCTAGGANANGQWSGERLATGNMALNNLTQSGVNTFSLVCTKGGINSEVASVDVTVDAAPGAPVVNLSANPVMNVPYNDSTVLTWSSTGAVGTCTASGGWTGAKALSGMETINNLLADTTFNLSCVNSINLATNVSVNVTVVVPNPSLTFTVNNAANATIIKGDSVTLAWNPTDLASCTASSVPANAAWTGAKDVAQASYSEVIANIQASTTFTLSCIGIEGSNLVQSVTVTANPDPELALGKTEYDLQCAFCHGAAGEGSLIYAFPIGPNMCTNNTVPVPPNQEVCGDQATLENYLTLYMPTPVASTCEGDCARQVAKYILNNFLTD